MLHITGMRIERYGLLYDGILLGISSSYVPEGSLPSVSIVFSLDHQDESLWLVKTREQAENAANTDTSWYNADYETPSNPYVGKCQAVKVILNIDSV